MNDAAILANIRQLAGDLRTQVPFQPQACDAYKNLASVPGKGGVLTQWFNRETKPSRKRLLSDMLGLIARISYQQSPEFLTTTADELKALCDRIERDE